jgi:cytochrome c556
MAAGSYKGMDGTLASFDVTNTKYILTISAAKGVDSDDHQEADSHKNELKRSPGITAEQREKFKDQKRKYEDAVNKLEDKLYALKEEREAMKSEGAQHEDANMKENARLQVRTSLLSCTVETCLTYKWQR